MAMISCGKCSKTFSSGLKSCPFCSDARPFGNLAQKAGVPKAAIVAGSVLVTLLVFISAAGSGNKTSYVAQTSALKSLPASARALSPNAVSQPEVSPPAVAEVARTLMPAQQNAARSAQDYIGMSGFSRKCLIRQLSSSAGDGYDIVDATVAVDSLNIDWKEQAVRSAKDYLNISGFSCNGLIRQPSSSSGGNYTDSEARCGAIQAGAC